MQGNKIEDAERIEKQINQFRNKLKETHLKSIEKGKYKFESGMIYTDLFAAIESIGDRVFAIAKQLQEESPDSKNGSFNRITLLTGPVHHKTT